MSLNRSIPIFNKHLRPRVVIGHYLGNKLLKSSLRKIDFNISAWLFYALNASSPAPRFKLAHRCSLNRTPIEATSVGTKHLLGKYRFEFVVLKIEIIIFFVYKNFGSIFWIKTDWLNKVIVVIGIIKASISMKFSLQKGHSILYNTSIVHNLKSILGVIDFFWFNLRFSFILLT